MERCTNDDPDDVGASVPYAREYWYDPGGNRLAMRVSDPASGEVQSITRYNYFAPGLANGTMTSATPGTPRVGPVCELDYAGRGKNRLLSTQTYDASDPGRVHVVQYHYGGFWSTSNQEDITRKTEATYVWDDSAEVWFESFESWTNYGYYRGQLEYVHYQSTDYCPAECETCPPDGPCDPQMTEWTEYYVHDIFGRRIAKRPAGGTEKGPAIMYDYDGLSQTVLAERHSGVDFGPEQGLADDIIATYTHGPLGMITRTDELNDYDPHNNRDNYYLSDGMGGHVGILLDHDGLPETSRLAEFQSFDAFGAPLTKRLPSSPTYAWRGAEGSKTDNAPNLVEMGARTYDPALGRFLQADALPIAGVDTQAMNRYIYCANDPVNYTLTLHKSSRFVRFGALKLGVPTIGSPRRQTSRHVRLANTGVWTANDCDFPGDSAISGIPGLRLMQREGTVILRDVFWEHLWALLVRSAPHFPSPLCWWISPVSSQHCLT